jgi:catecholate siderophore receptor
MRTPFVAFLISLLMSLTLNAADRFVRGNIVDQHGKPVAGAVVVLHTDSTDRETATAADGSFSFGAVPRLPGTITVSFDGRSKTAELDGAATELELVLQSAAVAEEITIVAPSPIPVRSSTATRTDTPLRDVPQSVSVITRGVMEQQSMQSVADVVRYVPGVGIAQGEGNRDTPVFRGNSSTSDFFVDGVRDDVQYFRDVYNVERVETFKGANAMIFGRGGVGGVFNRVTRQAEWTPSRELSVQGGSWNNGRVTADFGQAFGERVAARVTGLYQDADSYRDGVRLGREGINPTMAVALGANTMFRAGYEYFHDERTADRGISSFAGRPVKTDPSTFFGNADSSMSEVSVNALSATIDHRFSDRLTLRSRIGYGDYDKFYQNVYPGAVDAAGSNVNISAYNNATQRQNLFSQTDLVFTQKTGSVGHTILAGVELGRQQTANFRQTGYFTAFGSNATTAIAPLSNPTVTTPVSFRQSATDADNDITAEVGAIYLQDQIVVSPLLQLIAGLRYDDFTVDLTNNRTSTSFSSSDGVVSPRFGVVLKPRETISLYASYSLSFLPRAGEQLSSLNASNQSLEPEEFRSYEVGAKWDVGSRLEVSTAVYRLDRGNVAVADPVNPAVTNLIDGQRTEGAEISVTGNVTPVWSVVGAYAFQDGEILESISASAAKGARLAQLPEHSFSLWNKYDFSRTWGVGLGFIHRDEIFASTDNKVVLPSFTRVDGALFYTLTQKLRAQLNVENLLDTNYYATAHSNTNITPGAPRSVRLSWTFGF